MGDQEQDPVDEEEKSEGTLEDWKRRALKAESESIKRKEQRRTLEAEVGELKAKVKEYDDQDKTELQKTQAQLVEVQRELEQAKSGADETLIRSELLVALTKAGAKDPTDAYKLANLDVVKVDNGQVSGVEEVVNDLMKSKDYLFGEAAKPPPPEPGGGGSRPDNNPAGKPTFAQALSDALKKKPS